jgi:hypothetical protein
MDIYEGNLPEMRYNVPLKKYFDENSPFMNPNKVYVVPKKKVQKTKKTYFFSDLEDGKEKDDQEENDEDLNLDIVPEIYKNEIIDQEIDSELYIAKNESNVNDEIMPRYYLFLGDNWGNVKALDLMGFFKKYNIEPASKATIKSSFNIMKKDDINVETLINHNLTPQGNNVLPKYTNMYHKMIRNEFAAHTDSITCLTIIKEPLCFVTASKDKFVKIWDINCNCLGVINALPKLSKMEGEIPPWTFKINEEKILEDEIAEVVGIFEEVGVEPIEVGSKMDKEVDKIEVREKIETHEDHKKEVTQFIKRKFKKLEKKDKNTRKKYVDDNKTNLSYEGFYVQNTQKNIESLLEEQVSDVGINEIAKKFIENVVDSNKNKKKRMNKKVEYENEQNERDNITERRKGKPKFNLPSKKLPKLDEVFPFQKSYTQQGNLNRFNKKTENSVASPVKPKESLLSYSNKDKENEITVSTNYNNYISLKNSNLPKNWKINNLKKHTKHTEIFKKKEDNTDLIISDMSENTKDYINNPKKKKVLGRNFNGIRDTFYSEKLLGKTVTSLRTDLDKKKNKFSSVNKFRRNLTNLQLPFLNDKIIFNRGETEKLLNLHFYKSSYKACCEIIKQNDMPNSSIQKNYKNNWKLVEQYARDIRNRKNVLVKKSRNTSLNFYKRPKPFLKTTSPTTE